MAIKFLNIRSKEVRVAETEPLIAALYNSSDKGPNANNGQDFGWRLAPEVVVEIRRIKSDPNRIQEIANRFRKPYDEVGETDILKFISDLTSVESAPVAKNGDYDDADYESDYHAKIAELERTAVKAKPQPEDDLGLDEDVELSLDKTPSKEHSKPGKAA